jgi:hypothetical protein
MLKRSQKSAIELVNTCHPSHQKLKPNAVNYFLLLRTIKQLSFQETKMTNSFKQNSSLSALFSKSFQLFLPVSIFTVGICSNAIGIEKPLTSTLSSADNYNLSNGKSIILALISRTEFLENYPSGTTLCFNDRSVENKVQIVDFNQSFQVVDFVYLDGGYQGQKGSADYSTFVRNAYPCSY